MPGSGDSLEVASGVGDASSGFVVVLISIRLHDKLGDASLGEADGETIVTKHEQLLATLRENGTRLCVIEAPPSHYVRVESK